MNTNYTLVCISCLQYRLNYLKSVQSDIVGFTTPIDDKAPSNVLYGEYQKEIDDIQKTINYLESHIERRIL